MGVESFGIFLDIACGEDNLCDAKGKTGKGKRPAFILRAKNEHAEKTHENKEMCQSASDASVSQNAMVQRQLLRCDRRDNTKETIDDATPRKRNGVTTRKTVRRSPEHGSMAAPGYRVPVRAW